MESRPDRSFFQVAVVSILLYECTTWTLTTRMEKKLDGNYKRMLRVILNQIWRQDPTNQQLCGHLPPITKTIQVRRTRDAGHCWRSRDELTREVLLWTPSDGRAKSGRPARSDIQHLCADRGCISEDLPKAMDDREEWWEKVREIRAYLILINIRFQVFGLNTDYLVSSIHFFFSELHFANKNMVSNNKKIVLSKGLQL